MKFSWSFLFPTQLLKGENRFLHKKQNKSYTVNLNFKQKTYIPRLAVWLAFDKQSYKHCEIEKATLTPSCCALCVHPPIKIPANKTNIPPLQPQIMVNISPFFKGNSMVMCLHWKGALLTRSGWVYWWSTVCGRVHRYWYLYPHTFERLSNLPYKEF